jgi:hypothetical protein
MKVKVYVVFFAAKHSNEQQIDFIFTNEKQAQDYVDKQNKKKIKSIAGVTREDIKFGDDIQFWYEQEILVVKDDPIMNVMDHLFG